MMRRLFALASLSLATACFHKDETISGYVDRSVEWELTQLDGSPFAGRATLSFPEPGIATGRGPCNRFKATQTVPYPWISIDDIITTRAACPQLAAEALYLDALSAMTLVEAGSDILILSNDMGREMVFGKP